MANLQLFDLSGKKALVTGGGQGVGRACAIALAMGGADVAIVGRNEVTGRRVAASLQETGSNATFVRCDVTEATQIDAMLQEVVSRFGRLDIAVNCAGIYRSGNDESQDKADWDAVIATNLTGTWLCARAEMQQMAKQTPSQGKIINIASLGAHIACSNGAYDASKAGVVQLTRTLAARWGRFNINVNSISPGYVIGTRSLDERQRLRNMTPLGHVQRLEDLYGPVQFLASSASDYVTGQDLIVDGGHSLSTWMIPLERSLKPRVDPAEEVIEIKRDLKTRGIPHDENGIPLSDGKLR